MSYIIMLVRLAIILTLASLSQPLAAKTLTETIRDETRYFADQDPDGDDNIKGFDYFAPSRPAIGKKVFIFDPNYRAWAVYDENGKLKNTGKASGGKLYCPDVGRRCTTVTGEFTITSKSGPGCRSSKYPIGKGGARMPYCMHFGRKGYAIHGSNDVPDDRNASHGCIRVTPRAAKWINLYFLKIGSKVIVLPYSKR